LNATAQMDENVSVDAYCAEFDNEDPQIVKPKTLVLIISRNPTLHVQSVFDNHTDLAHYSPTPRLYQSSGPGAWLAPKW
jgi:hypothetical protein